MTTRADTSTSTRQEIETLLDAFYAAWQARDGWNLVHVHMDLLKD